MAEIKVTKVPVALKRFLKSEAAQRDMTLSELVIEGLNKAFPILPKRKQRTSKEK